MYKRIFFIWFMIIFLGIYEILQIVYSLNNQLTIHLFINLTIPAIVILIYILTLVKKDYNSVSFSLGNFLSFVPVLTFANLISGIINEFIYVSSIFKVSIDSYYFVVTLVEGGIFLTMYLLFYKKSINTQLSKFFKNIFKYLLYIFFFYIIVVFLNDLLAIIASFIPATEQEAANQSEIINTLVLQSSKIFFIIVLIFIGPIIEEFIYRYIFIEQVIIKGFKLNLMTGTELFNCKNKKLVLKQVLIMLIIAIFSGFFFASAHAIAADTLINYVRDLLMYSGFAIGISLAYLYTRNIMVGLSIHMLNNLISILLIFLTQIK
ncbi:MAG: type II CAAX prenyl endopeptidase Rce1 family protein [Mycoplasmatales bacterium]